MKGNAPNSVGVWPIANTGQPKARLCVGWVKGMDGRELFDGKGSALVVGFV